MKVIVIVLIVALVYVLTRFYFLKKEIKSTTRQLHELNHHQTAKKITMSHFDSDLETLAQEINHQIDLTKEAQAEKRSTENELKQAISHISHDIRTPMTSILGYIQFLESDDISPDMKKEYIETIKNSAGRLKILLEDFFELSIIEQVDYPLKMEKANVNELVLEVLFGFYEEFNRRNIEPQIVMPERDTYLMVDPSAFKRVVENLVVNAMKYSTGEVAIKLEQVDKAVHLTISNSTDQLTNQDIQYMFDRFYKADQTRAGKGTGLGLPIAKSLMEKMNGGIRAELKDQKLMMMCEWRLE